MLTNKLPNHDELGALKPGGVGADIINGRPLLSYAQDLSGRYSASWKEGLLAIFFIAITAMILSNIFHTKNKITNIFLGLTLAIFPTVAACLGHMYSGDIFFLCNLLAIFPIYMLEKIHNLKNKKALTVMILSGLSLSVGLCIYQSCFFYCIAVIFILFIIKEIDCRKASCQKEWCREVRADFLKYMSYLILGLLLYYLFVKLSLWVTGETLTSRKGISSFGIDTLVAFPDRFIECYKQLFWYIFKRNSQTTWGNIARIASSISAVMTIGMCVYLIKVKKIFSYWLRSLYTIIAICLLPFAIEFIYIIVLDSQEVNYHMSQALVLWFVFILIVLDRFINHIKKNKINAIKSISIWIFVICISIMQGDNWIFTANGYDAAYFAYEQTYSYFLKMSMRIEEIEEFTYDMPIALVGKFDFEDRPQTISMLKPFTATSDEKKYGHPVNSLPGSHTLITTYANVYFFKYYLGENYTFCSNDKVAELNELQEVQEMPSYPKEGSIKVIDGILVIKR